MTPAEDWVRTRLKYLVDCNAGTLPETTDPAFEITYVDIGNVTQGFVNVAPVSIKFGEAPSRARRLASPGDSIVSTVRTYLRAVAPVPETDVQLVFSTGFAVLSPRESVNAKYLTWYLQSDQFVAGVERHSVGVSYPAITAKEVISLRVHLPPLDQQIVIADYLDRETAQIDTLIEEQQRLVALLRERRLAVAAHYFQPPEGKLQTTVKRTLTPVRRAPTAGLGVITAYRDGAVTLRSRRRDDGYALSDLEKDYQQIEPGDLVFHALDGFAGAVGVSDSRGVATPVYHVCAALAGNDLQYVAMLLRYLGQTGFLETQAPNTRQRSVDFRNWSTFGRVPIAVHPREHQQRVVAEIRGQSASIDLLIAETERFIDLARERRSALITASVTGQIDVRDKVA